MRLLVILAVLLVGVIALGLWVNHSLDVAAKDLEKNINQVSEQIDTANWDNAYKQTVAFENTWKQKETWWPVVLDHQEMDNIDFSLAKAKEYIRAKDKVLSLGQLAELRLMILHLPEKEAVNLKNIL